MILSVFTPGTITLDAANRIDGEGFDHSGAHATYNVSEASKVVEIVNRHDFVVRPNGKTEDAKSYTAKKAANDLK